MNFDVFMAGYGGQGVILMGNLLAFSGMLEDRNVSFFPAYGVEKRGGAATCTVVISDQEVGSPVVGHPAAALILNQVSMDKYFDRVKTGGVCLVNSCLVEPVPDKAGVDAIWIPLNEMALALGNAKLANMIAIGAYAEMTGAVCVESLKKALTKVLPPRNHSFIPLNESAIEAGAAFVREGRGRAGTAVG